MLSLKLKDLKNISHEDFSLIKFNDNKFILKYKNDNFIIDTETEFYLFKIYKQNNIYKFKFVLNENEDSYKNFIDNINLLYEIISNIIKEEYDIFVSRIIRPIYGQNNIKLFYASLNKNTYIANIENHDKLKMDDINYKVFALYPFLCSPVFNLSNECLYINFNFYSCFIKIIKSKQNISIDYKNN